MMPETEEMHAALVVAAPGSLAMPLREVELARDELAASTIAAETVLAYAKDWKAWSAFARTAGVGLYPAAPEHVASFATVLFQEGKRYSTIERRIVGLSQRHRRQGDAAPIEHPLVRATLRGIRRKIGRRKEKKRAITATQLERMIRETPEGPIGARNRAILSVGFCGAFRRSELAGLTLADVVFSDDGMRITVRSSKTDQGGLGLTKGLPQLRDPALCPVRLLQAWIAVRGELSGPLFLSFDARGRAQEGRLTQRPLRGATVALVVKEAARRAGVDPSLVAAHSLRHGFISYAIRAGAQETQIMAITGHRHHATMSGYFQQENAIRQNPIGGMF